MSNENDFNIDSLLSTPITVSYQADSWSGLQRALKNPRIQSHNYSLLIVADTKHKKICIERTFPQRPPEDQVEKEYESMGNRLERELAKIGIPAASTRIFIPEDFYGRVPENFSYQYSEVSRDVLATEPNRA